MEMHEVIPRARRALGKHRHRVAIFHGLRHQAQHPHGVSSALPHQVQCAGVSDQAPDQRPVRHLGLGHKARRHDRIDGHDVQPGDMVGHHQLGPRPGLPLHAQMQTEDAQQLA